MAGSISDHERREPVAVRGGSVGAISGARKRPRAGADRYWFYGSGKAALRDGLTPLATAGGNVLLPTYVPDAVAEPIADFGCKPWW